MGLLQYRDNTHSQNGEDGVLAEIITRLGLRDGAPRWCVEFGAWDGVHLSKTFLLVEEHGWNAIYIEGDPEKYRDLLETVENPDAMFIEDWLGTETDRKATVMRAIANRLPERVQPYLHRLKSWLR